MTAIRKQLFPLFYKLSKHSHIQYFSTLQKPTHIEQAEQAFKQHEYKKTITLCEQILKQSPQESLKAHKMIAYSEAQLGNITNASIHAQKALEIQPDDEQMIMIMEMKKANYGTIQKYSSLIRFGYIRSFIVLVVVLFFWFRKRG